jgi:hypothetical protein
LYTCFCSCGFYFHWILSELKFAKDVNCIFQTSRKLEYNMNSFVLLSSFFYLLLYILHLLFDLHLKIDCCIKCIDLSRYEQLNICGDVLVFLCWIIRGSILSFSNKICLIWTCNSYLIVCWDVDIDGSVLFKLIGFYFFQNIRYYYI